MTIASTSPGGRSLPPGSAPPWTTTAIPGQHEVEVRPASVPPDLARRCRRLAHSLGLPLAGIDLRCTPDGRWYCFEVNPSPGFAYYERATGQPISQAIARLLAGDGSQRDP